MADIFSDKISLKVRTGRSIANKMVSALDGEKLDLFEQTAEQILNEHPKNITHDELILQFSSL